MRGSGGPRRALAAVAAAWALAAAEPPGEVAGPRSVAFVHSAGGGTEAVEEAPASVEDARPALDWPMAREAMLLIAEQRLAELEALPLADPAPHES